MIGKSKIELFTNGKKDDEYINSNIVTNAIQNMLAYNPILGYPIPASWICPIATNCYQGLLLWDDTITEDADNIIASPSIGLLGHASRTYSGANPLRGNYNINESMEITGGYRHVWDFGTDKVNGLIKALSLTSPNIGDQGFASSVDYTNPTIYGRNFMTLVDNYPYTDITNLPSNPNWRAFYTKFTGPNPYVLAYDSVSASGRGIYKYSLPASTQLGVNQPASSSYYKINPQSTSARSSFSYTPESTKYLEDVFGQYANLYWYEDKLHIIDLTDSTTLVHSTYTWDDTSFVLDSTTTITLDTAGAVSTNAKAFCLNDYYFVKIDGTHYAKFDNTGALQTTVSWTYGFTQMYFYGDKCFSLYRSNYSHTMCMFDGDNLQVFPFSCPNYNVQQDIIYSNISLPTMIVYMGGYRFHTAVYPAYLATINNLETPVLKTSAQTMKVTYELYDAT